MDNLTQILEAILFASGSSRKKADIMALLPDVKKAQFDKSIEELKAKYSGESGVLLLDFNGKLQFYSSVVPYNTGLPTASFRPTTSIKLTFKSNPIA